MMQSVPSLSYGDVRSAQFAAQIAAAFEQYGFVVITDHGLAQDLCEQFLALYKQFFALPEPIKRRYSVPGGGGARGYTAFGIETAKGASHHDLKEFWHTGRELEPGHRYTHDMPPNVWVEEIADFRAVTTQMFDAFDRMGRRLLMAIAQALGLAVDYFEDKVNEGNSVLRVIHYPPMAPQPTPSLRAGAHEDINVITLLMGADEPGLQLLTARGQWLPVNPPPGSLVVNVGDMLQRLTNNILRSTTHRVVNPASDRAGFARYSMPFFLHFNPDFLIRTLPSCVSAERPDAYAPITANDYLLERLREIKLL